MDIAERQKPKPGELFLDHVAHFVPDLAAAGKLLEALGFVVTPESAHRADGGPAGTSNRCLMFEEGYIEILAPTLDTPNARRVRTLMSRYDGVHLVCFGTPDAAGEHRRLAAHGFEPEPLVNLQRTVDSGGTVRFNVIYVPPQKMPEGRIQYVQQLTPEQIWLPKYVAHENGALGLAAVYVEGPDPVATAARWARFAGLLPRPEGDAVRLETARGTVIVREGAMPSIAGYALKCRDPRAFLKRCREHGLAVVGQRVQLPPALGGTWTIT